MDDDEDISSFEEESFDAEDEEDERDSFEDELDDPDSSVEVPRALYVRASAAHLTPYPDVHLARLLWSYHRSLQLDWDVAYGWPEIDESVPEEADLFEVAVVEENAVPPRVLSKGLTPADLYAKRIIWVSAAAQGDAPQKAAPVQGGAFAVLQFPVSYEKFCAAIAEVVSPALQPYDSRFEYHTLDVLRDIWGEAQATTGDWEGVDIKGRPCPKPKARYALDDALDASRKEALVVTRRRPPFTLLYANAAFWKAVGWEKATSAGRNLSFLQGPKTQKDVLARLHARLLSEDMRDKGVGAFECALVNYTQKGAPFTNHLKVSPCVDASLYIGAVTVGESTEDDAPRGDEATVAHILAAGADRGADSGGLGAHAGAEGEADTRHDPGDEADEVLAEALERVLLDETANVVVTKAERPFAIVHVNDAWGQLCHMDPAEVVGKQSLNCIQGPLTDPNTVSDAMQRLVTTGEPVDMHLINYKKGGKPFANHVFVEPICDKAGVPRYFVGRLNEEVPPPGVVLPLPRAEDGVA